MRLYGEFAALLTAVLWAFNSVLFTFIGKRVGASTLNHLRIWMAFVLMCVLHLVMFGTVFPFEMTGKNFIFLALSGIIGLTVGDTFLYQSFLLIGPRLSMLVMLSAPVFSAFLAWIVLGEVLAPIKIIGILVTIGGIAWVVLERPGGQNKKTKIPGYMMGILLGVGGAVGQAVGLLFSRMGMEGGFSAISASHVRIASAAVLMAIVAIFRGKMREHLNKVNDKKLFFEVVIGVITGPIAGIILSLVAIAHTQIGTASAIMSIAPVLLIPVSHFVFKEKVTLKAVLGTIIAILGVLLLFVN
jgi:drug/metabolite transporter (DMT)-like permease